ncbi:MAG: class I SAM-dependent methyltransferase [Candidatus Eisenbacteria bacterium]|uniref:Class I SAM-dependent methyltransferase n=1 Tax=Eiseniibacteriota bacterium TaxID=2212470 RepID=A0A538S8N9_UNCEI|nr:MAG: class I SAM-dependent methyltransferase [Candidatus Eisenbacteria bacterium]
MVRALSKTFRRLVDRYHGPEGDDFARAELTPVAARFLTPRSRVLEVGCGYGRNLVALAGVEGCTIVGSDVSAFELERAAAERIGALPAAQRARVSLVRQESFRLPFRDSTFDLVVLWQVVEHLFGEDAKRRVLAECLRVLKSGGHLLIETPNQWFPVDYHDNLFPFAHWILPKAAREWITWKVRGKRYPPSEYVSLPGCERILRAVPDVLLLTRATRFYFGASWREAWRRLAGTRAGLKRAIFVAILPLHALLTWFGSSGDLFLPSLRVVWRVDKRGRSAP